MALTGHNWPVREPPTLRLNYTAGPYKTVGPGGGALARSKRAHAWLRGMGTTGVSRFTGQGCFGRGY